MMFSKIFIYLFDCAESQLQPVGSLVATFELLTATCGIQFPNQGVNQVSCIGSLVSQPVDHQGSPQDHVYDEFTVVWENAGDKIAQIFKTAARKTGGKQHTNVLSLGNGTMDSQFFLHFCLVVRFPSMNTHDFHYEKKKRNFKSSVNMKRLERKLHN